MAYIIGQQGDGNEPAGYLPTQVVNTARALKGEESGQVVKDVMSMVAKTCRRAPAMHVKNLTSNPTRRRLLWENTDTKAKLYVWADRGFVHIERNDGAYKKWMLRDAAHLADALGEQIDVTKYADERQIARNAYLTLLDVCQEAKNQGDPTEMTAEEERSLRETIACVTLPGYGNIIREKKVSFVGGHAVLSTPGVAK